MASSTGTGEIEFPSLPADHDGFIKYLAENPQSSVLDLVEPYKHYDAELRKVFAQQPDHPAAKQPNVVPVFTGQEEDVKIRARNLDSESKEEKECYIMPLKDEDRRPDGASAIVQSLDNFRTNFNVFSESSLVDLDWSNVVVAGSAVATCLLAVPERVGSKRDLRQYYHEKLAPASDVDLFVRRCFLQNELMLMYTGSSTVSMRSKRSTKSSRSRVMFAMLFWSRRPPSEPRIPSPLPVVIQFATSKSSYASTSRSLKF